MVIVIFISIFTLFLTYLSSHHNFKGALELGFVLITILGAVHYDYGRDYMDYYHIYQRIINETFNLEYVFSGMLFRDPGWVLLCYLFKPIGGFFMMVAVLTFIQNYIIYKFIKREVQQKWWPLAMFIFLFNTSFYLLSFSMLRQWFVMCIFLALWSLIKEKKVVWPLIIIFLSSFVHGASLFLIPFVFISYLKINRKTLVILMLVFLSLAWVSKDFIVNILNRVSTIDEFNAYFNAYGDRGFSIGIGYLVQTVPLFTYLYYIASSTPSNKALIVLLASVSYLISPFGQQISLIIRLAYFFDLFSMAAIPIAYQYLRHDIRLGLLFLFIVMKLYNYFTFFYNPLWEDSYGEFHTIFSVI